MQWCTERVIVDRKKLNYAINFINKMVHITKIYTISFRVCNSNFFPQFPSTLMLRSVHIETMLSKSVLENCQSIIYVQRTFMSKTKITDIKIQNTINQHWF